ncbi:MAG: NUDIX hydrolase [Bacteroidales bacterium]|nr:NUDIX hydrolase [Bacteroidales bacterium]MBN2821398.1 NUDIX hydrolase [Bacteroidales bacterium]
MAFDWLDIAKKLQAIAQAGLEFGADKYDLERYEMIRSISVDIMHAYTDAPIEKIRELFAEEKGYQTPKVDIRGVVFREGKLLMVQEGIDGNWTLPGGWADVGYTPFEVAEKEVWEEAGLKVKPDRLLAVFDKSKHNHPPDKYHIYKFFILCDDLGGEIKPGMETLDVKWMSEYERLPLSTPRISQEQINIMFEFLDSPEKPVICD